MTRAHPKLVRIIRGKLSANEEGHAEESNF